MKVKPIKSPLPGERVVSVHPRMAVQVDAAWRRRLNLYTGRTLSDTALRAEQDGRLGRLVTMGQSISPGVVSGLECGLDGEFGDFGTPGPGISEGFLDIAPGVGLTHRGEDVVLPHALRVKLTDLYVDADGQPLTLRSPLDVAIVVLEPVTLRRAGRFAATDPCDVDESEDAFADEQVVDGCRVRLMPWDDRWFSLPPLDVESPTALADLSRFRSRLAYGIYERERHFGPGDQHPWEHYGVPIALLTLMNVVNGEVRYLFPWYLERFSVVRAGGYARARTPLVRDTGAAAGTAFLWQARVQQFAEQVADGERNPYHSVPGAFEVFPPAGLLPFGALRRYREDDYRRNDYDVELAPPGRRRMAPVPLEQLDHFLSRSASLAPLAGYPDPEDINVVPDQDVLILVPVPQVVYEPRLLLRETVSPIFQQTIWDAQAARDNARAVRWSVRRDYRFLVRVTEGPGRVPRYDDFNDVPRDPDALDDELEVREFPDDCPPGEIVAMPNPPERGGRFGVSGPTYELYLELFEDLKETLQHVDPSGRPHPVFSGSELDELAENGLEPFIKRIEEKLGKADDTIDLSFLKSHPNIYRLRQLMLGATASTRLATSPVLATIAKGASAQAVTAEINRFFYAVKGRKPPGTQPQPARPAAAPAPVPVRVTGPFVPASTVYRGGALTRLAPVASVFQREGSTAFPALGVGGIKAKMKTETGRTSIVILPQASTRQTVQQSSPIVGDGAYDFRTSSIAERIEDSPSREAKAYAVAAKAEAMEALQLLHQERMNVHDIPVFGLPVIEGGQPVFHLRFVTLAGVETANERNPDGTTNFINPRAGLVRRLPNPIDFGDLFDKHGGIGRILRDPPGHDADEGNLFADSVRVIEHSIATLRAVEGRIAAYRADVQRCRDTLDEINKLKNAAGNRLADLDGNVAEERHRIRTATALRADETRRLELINRRRDEVLDKHVQFYAYVRPRFAEALLDAPTVNLDPGLFESPVPACLGRHNDAPYELNDMVQLLREAPVVWFKDAPALLDGLDRVELMHGTLQISKLRAMALKEAAIAPTTFLQREVVGTLGKAIARTSQAQQRVITDFRIQVAQLDLARFGGMGWRETREEVVRVLSLGDLIESNHGRSAVAEKAASELNRIREIAACLHAQVSDVPPAIRLEWADRLGQYEESVELRDLTALPRWGEVPYVDRKEIQILADWLYGRIAAKQPEALAWMHDLVRVCILLASHAPVNAIIAGSVPVETAASPGQTVPVSIDPARVRLGMKVMFFRPPQRPGTAPSAQPELLAHGIVEDLVGGQARARIAETIDKSVLLVAGTRVHFVDPDARTAPTFFRKPF